MNLSQWLRFPCRKRLSLDKKCMMDLQTRKLNLIGYLIELQDEKILSKIESQILGNGEQCSRNFKQFTQEELLNRAEEATNDYRAGRIKTQDQLDIESKNW